MKDLGCKNTINLDGGGFSTLWIEGKRINQAIGDKDEDVGIQKERLVLCAIIF